ncbi:AAA family ATPase [Erythrobacter sp. WG]|uniref:AAA family ATPase n=1 Tax=Erythrobacter sp. WG TaxID=2985510 RepID=UPI00226EABD9|nr:AAA family ATPase [Erythrobacter sp. WG]MCX9146592.1 AAA family ATPase [Erythrobacter sp. WG]
MINVKDLPVDVVEMRLWLNGYRELSEPPMPWSQLARETGIPQGTLTTFAAGTYAAKDGGSNVARKVFQFKQSVEAQAMRQDKLPVNPGYFDTRTSLRMMELLEIAHSGRMTLIGTGPGTGKTMTIDEYAERTGPVWKATMKPSSNSLHSMIREVQKALGVEPRRLSTADASALVVTRMTGRKGVLVVDEANWLSLEAIEELRYWHDETGVGICFLGNEELVQRIKTGPKRDQLARLQSRIANMHVQRTPEPEDVTAFCDHWGIDQPDIRRYLVTIATTPDSGGLRECKQLVEAASMLAAADDRGLSIGDLRDAQSERATRWIRA